MKTHIITIHGGETFGTYDAYISWLTSFTPDFERMKTQGWKDTLGEQLGDAYEVMHMKMPNSLNAKYLEWRIWFEKFIPVFQDDAIFVGNSLGAIFLAKYFSENEYPKKVKAIFLLAAPYGSVSPTDDPADFIPDKDMSRLAAYGNKVHLYHSTDDPVVPFSHLAEYQKHLPQARARVFDTLGHFNIAEIPELVEDIRALGK